MNIKTIGSRIYPFYQTTDGVGSGRRVFFQLADYENNPIGSETELVHRSFGLFAEDDDSNIRFPKGHDLVFGRYFPRLADGINADNSISVGLDVFQLINPPLGMLNGKISQSNFLQGSPGPTGVIGSQITFDMFLTDAHLNRPANIGSADRVEVVFRSEPGTEVVVPVLTTSASNVGFLTVDIPPDISSMLNPDRPGFLLRIYVAGEIESVTKFPDALKLYSENR